MRAHFTFWRRMAALFVIGWLALAPMHAGGSANVTYGVDRYGEAAIRDLALRLNDALDSRKVNLAIVARAGRPREQLPKGVNFTHVAFIVFEPVRGADGKPFYTYTVYNLYQGDKGKETECYLKQDLTYDFVAGVVEPDVAVCVPVDALQQRIVRVIRSSTYRALFIPQYNLVANPWVDRYDNCVTHMLKVCVAAIYQTSDRQRIDENIRTYFKPTRIHLGFFQSIGSNFIPEVRRDDEDPSGLQTATYDSLVGFLAENGMVKETLSVRVHQGGGAGTNE